ncbi:MAG: alpha-2-macroglobulin family protein [Pedobacter sp.]|uniref:alpha-2-macroglobulin family protein n=1 Tax=Pedobacter sp. TaxID=1411316 RepID=UPI00280A070B|nr:alpha-2-macroglobulin family protein [Pedobacter sp.]MDQ8006579.1 alpha-2-macroglobulin family protein [Pedobacter sp.]
MKLALPIIFVISILSFNSIAQNKLSKSKQVGEVTAVYKINDKEVVSILKDKKVNDDFFHTLTSTDYYKEYRKKDLPFGNYLMVSASGGYLNTSLKTQNNVSLQFINNQKDFQFYIADVKGNLVENAVVEIDGKRKAQYDSKAKLYRSTYSKEEGKPKEEGLIKVTHDGVSNFFEYELDDNNRYNDDDREDWPFFKKVAYAFPVKYFWQPFKNTFKKRRTKKPLYAGYMVFSKPIYKPLDTVKFKAYLINYKGGEIKNKPANVVLQANGNKTLATINPYKNGGYEYSFVLADSLNLKLDRSYSITLAEKAKNEKKAFRIANNFRYEDYELKALDFSLRTDKDIQTKDSVITVYFKATDENELAVPDGRVELTLTAGHVNYYADRKVFVPDTLWQKNITLDPVGETKLVLPADIFPKANFSFYLEAKFLNSNNEVRTASKSLSYNYTNLSKKSSKPFELKSDFKKDSLTICYLVDGKSTSQAAKLVSYTANDVVINSQQITLPFKLKTDYRAEYYEVETSKDTATIFVTSLKPELQINAVQNKDSLRVVVINEHKIPFWYTVFAGDKVFLRGYTNQLDTLIKNDSKKASHIRINYIWDEDEVTSEVSAVYNPNQLNLKLIAPDMVYPGQKVNMLVQVTDINHKPVAETDVTAQAFTAKFKDVPSVRLPYLGRKYLIRKQNKIKVEADEAYGSVSKNLDKLAWTKWSKSLGLDSIEYFKFTHPNPIYTVVEATNDTTTQVAPFVVLDGQILPASIVYIDNVPVFFNQSHQLQRYSFLVKPGFHDFKIRTADKLVTVKNYHITAGKKTIFSVLADTTNKFYAVNKPTTLTADESQELDNYMIRIANNANLNKTTVTAQLTDTRLLINPNNRNDRELLVGPIRENHLIFDNEKWHQNFVKEAGYTYTFEPGLIKQKSNKTKYAFNTKLDYGASNRNTNFAYEYALKKKEIDQIWLDFLNLRSRTTQLFDVDYKNAKPFGKLRFDIDTAFTNHIPYIKNVIAFKPNQPQFLRIYKGETNTDNLESGKYKLLFLLRDNSYFVTDSITVKANGANYYSWSSFKITPANVFSTKLDSMIKATPSVGRQMILEQHRTFFNSYMFDKNELKKTVKGRVLSSETNKPVKGVTVKVVDLDVETISNAQGWFELKIPELGALKITASGYYSKVIDLNNTALGDIILDTIGNVLRGIEVIGYGSVAKKSLTGSVATVTSNELVFSLQGGAPGASLQEVIMIRGANSINANQKPLIILDGVPYDGDITTLDKDVVKDITVLKDASATAIYGARAANGVIIIKSKTGNLVSNATGELVAQQQTLRTNFNDEGFWQPKLITDENGIAKFTVKFPDDITKWTTRVMAMNGNKQTGYTEGSIKSFKSLSANFVSPLFAVTGDSINVIGKLMNYTPLEETGVRKFSYNGQELRNSTVKFKNSLIDTLGIVVKSKDSLNFEYTLAQDNGYFDGERRKIPVFEAGVKETKGYFSALLRDTTLNYSFDKNLGKITLRAEASVFPTLLDEMTKLRNYEYLCNEQLASKLKGLLLEKRVRKYLEQKFTHEKDIAFILKKLQQNKNPQGTWGWWQNTQEQMWISLHVVEALLQAQKDGYTVDLNKPLLQRYLVSKLSEMASYNDIQIIKLLHLLDGKNYIKDWVVAYEERELEKEKLRNANLPAELLALKQRETKASLYATLEMMELKQLAGLKVDLNSLLKLKKQTMFGSIYWGEENIRFWDNSIQNTLLAYRILKNAGGYENELEKIALYFLEQRKNGQWRNTYEASLILETILPAFMTTNGKAEPASIKVNDQVVTQFPFNKTIENATDLKVQKTGRTAVYFTAYQQFQNAKPNKVDKDFKVNSTLLQNGTATTKLKAGTLTKLKVEVEVKADADYVMIEIPIPAGCSYENKMQNFWGVETHREYFKNKTSIFCTKMKQGKYTFEIDLMPRYTGSYVLNPAKAELMYFPVFYGREGMKKVEIK